MNDPDIMLERARNLFFSQWEEILHLRLAVLRNCEHEDIHDLRVASRRFRAALNLLNPLCDSMDVQKVSRDVRRLTRTLGALRNLDEALAFFRSHAETISISSLTSRLAGMRGCEQQKVITALKKFKPKKLDSMVRGMAAEMVMDNMQKRGLPPLPSYLSNTALGLFETIHALLPAALPPGGTEERHALRIAIKKWRYFIEIVSRIVERNYDAVLERLKRYQSLLGSMNDMTVFGSMCRENSETADTVQQMITLETDRLYGAFVSLVKTEPLNYTFKI